LLKTDSAEVSEGVAAQDSNDSEGARIRVCLLVIVSVRRDNEPAT
jgi:hypothetical protein